MKRKRKRVDWLRVRIFFVLGFLVLLFGAVFLRAFRIQVLEGERLQKRAKNQSTKTIKMLPRRGAIYDRKLNELAVSIEVDSLYANPAKVRGRRKTAKALAPIVKMNRRKIERKLGSDKNFVWIKRQVDISKKEMTVVRGLKGIGTVKKSKRYYPNHQLASNLIGFEGIDSKGLEGVELGFDKYLKGEPVRVRGERDARGRVLLYEDLDKSAKTHGMDIVLTIDKVIQNIAERTLSKAVSDAKAKGGMAIVMDPNSGEVLAMANVPTFDPNRFHRFGPRQWRNRAVTDSFEPGSVMKAFLLASVLEEGTLSPDDLFFCENGSYKVSDRVFHDTKKHAWLSLAQIIKYSSNIGAAKVAEKFGKKSLYRYLKRFGFSKRTGIDLPGEGKGMLRHYSSWSGVTLQTVSFGQGVSTTGIQLVVAMSAIANGGYIMKPQIVKKITDPFGKSVYDNNPVVIQRVLSEETAKKATRILVGVTEPKGTGTKARVDGFKVAGKTGTAQKPDLVKGGYKRDAYIASFLGFIPARDPRLVIFVAIDEPSSSHYGGKHAAPVFSKIATQTLSYLGVFPQGVKDGEGFAPAVLETDYKDGSDTQENVLWVKKGIVPQFKGKSLRAVLRAANDLGAELSINGSGVAFKQRPSAGRAFMATSDPIKVWFK